LNKYAGDVVDYFNSNVLNQGMYQFCFVDAAVMSTPILCKKRRPPSRELYHGVGSIARYEYRTILCRSVVFILVY